MQSKTMQSEQVQSLNSNPSTDRASLSGSSTNNGESRINKRKKDESTRKRTPSIPNPTLTQTREEFRSDVPYPPRKKGRQHYSSQDPTRLQPVTQPQTQARTETRPAVPTKSPQDIQIQNDAYEKIYELERSRIIAEKAHAYDKIVGIVHTINPKSTLDDRDKAMKKVQGVVEAVKPDEEIEKFEA